MFFYTCLSFCSQGDVYPSLQWGRGCVLLHAIGQVEGVCVWLGIWPGVCDHGGEMVWPGGVTMGVYTPTTVNTRAVYILLECFLVQSDGCNLLQITFFTTNIVNWIKVFRSKPSFCDIDYFNNRISARIMTKQGILQFMKSRSSWNLWIDLMFLCNSFP